MQAKHTTFPTFIVYHIIKFSTLRKSLSMLEIKHTLPHAVSGHIIELIRFTILKWLPYNKYNCVDFIQLNRDAVQGRHML